MRNDPVQTGWVILSFVVGSSMLTALTQAAQSPGHASGKDRGVGLTSSRRAGGDGPSVVRAVVSPAWEIGVQKDLVAREYWITWQDRTPLDEIPAAWHAPNRAQGFRTYFTPEGIRMIPRAEDEPAWSWSLSLVAYGRGTIAHPMEPAKLFPDENRIRLDRREIDEWVVNEPRGLKHGFILHVPPNGGEEPIDNGHAVRLSLAVGGDLTPVVGADGRSIRFMRRAGPPGHSSPPREPGP